jgi:UDP-N-acetylglucosamine 4,6-dehydratase
VSVTATRQHPLLGRDEVAYPLPDLKGKKVVVTGGDGYIGQALKSVITQAGGWFTSADLSQAYDSDGHNVLNPRAMLAVTKTADIVLHLAADKHAPKCETYPVGVANVNIIGTANVVDACLANKVPKLVFASTCKAAQPETVYGASKLVSERIILNAGYTVARFYNVIETGGNVFAHWYDQSSTGDGSLQVAPCHRYFISIGEACSFLLSCVDREPGRYIPNPGSPLLMTTMARRWAHENGIEDPELKIIDRRKGDRYVEPPHADCETLHPQPDGAARVVSYHDQDIA